MLFQNSLFESFLAPFIIDLFPAHICGLVSEFKMSLDVMTGRLAFVTIMVSKNEEFCIKNEEFCI